MVAIVRIFLLFLVAFPIGNTYAGWFGPSNYEECILDKMKDAKNNYAAAAIAGACGKKFPPPKVKPVSQLPEMRSLPSDAVDRIRLACKERERIESNTGSKTITQYMKEYEREFSEHPDEIKCTIHNGNSTWSVSSVVIRIRQYGSVNHYDNDVSLTGLLGYYGHSGMGPLSTQDVSINGSMATGKIRTSIISAKGFAQ